MTMICVPLHPDGRSVQPLRASALASAFSKNDSTALFVGVRTFAHGTAEVPYAVDDAIDLAHRFALEPRVALIPPRRVVLALSGKPRKEESKQRLQKLKDAGARVEDATSGDILSLLERQAARVGTGGMLVLSLATHGFLHDDDAYVLGSTSTFSAPESAVRLATLLDIAGRTSRSLVLVDACRERVAAGARGAAPSAAPIIGKMSRVHGQAILYAAAPGAYAYDDEVSQNGVFTKAVLDGMSCAASAPRGEVIVSTLHTYVEREVRRWFERSGRRLAGPATQVSMEGETRNMPLAQCWRNPCVRIRISANGTTLTARDDDGRTVWQQAFADAIVYAETADLDADAFPEVVVGTRDGITVLDRDGQQLWERRGEAMSLRTFTTGDLFRKHTHQIVAIWTDGSRSRLTVFDSAGKELGDLEHAGQLQRVAVGRTTNMHAPKIVVAGVDDLVVIHAKRLEAVWQRRILAPPAIDDLRIEDANRDARRDIVIATGSGRTLFTFDGEILAEGGARWAPLTPPESAPAARRSPHAPPRRPPRSTRA